MWRVVGAYLAAAGTWILTSDYVAERLFSQELTRFQSYKGLGFVAVTAAALGWVLSREARRRQRVEADLADSEARYRTLFDARGDALLVVDEAGDILEANAVASILYGAPAAALRGRTLQSLRGPMDAELELPRHRRADGALFPVTELEVPVVLGGAPCTLWAVRDITGQAAAQRALMARERQITSIYSGVEDGLAYFAPRGHPPHLHVESFNPHFLQLCAAPTPTIAGWSVEEVERLPFMEGLTAALRERRAENRSWQAGGPGRDGEPRVLEISTFPVPGPHGRPDLLLTLRDVTARVQRARDTRQYALRLEVQVAERTRALEAAKADAEAAEQAKSALLSAMSHELRSPLFALLGFADVLLGPGGPDLTLEQRAHLDTIRASARHMSELVDDALDLSRMEAGRLPLTLRPVDAEQVSREVMAMFAPQAEDQGLAWTLEVEAAGLWVMADPRRLRQILVNLLSNALKFTHEGGVTLRLSAADGAGRLQVEDTGVGIPEADHSEIFLPFHQGQRGAGGELPGSGLGLAISQRLAARMSGDLRVSSAPGRGSTFTLTLAEAPRRDVG